MSRSRVEVVISAIDEASPVIAGIGRSMAGGVLNMGFDLAAKAAGGFMNAVDKASSAVTDNIMAVGSLASVMGVGYEKADKLNNKITQGLAKQAAALPGTTDDYVRLYRTVSDDVADMSKALNGGRLDTAKFEKQVVSLTSKFGALGVGGGASIGETTMGLQALLGGRDVSKLGKLKFFRERNPLLTKNLGKLEEKEGMSLSKMDKGKRLQVILKAVDMTLTDDTIRRMNASFDAIKQSFLTKLFDPNVGMFGLLRDVDGNLENGMQTAFEGITAALDSVIGENGIIMSLGKLLSALGLKGQDPMVTLRNGMLTFAGWMKGLASTFDGLSKLASDGGKGKDQAIAKLLTLPTQLGTWLAGLVNNLFAGMSGVDGGGLASIGGRIIGSILNGVMAFFTNLNGTALAAGGGMTLLPMIGTAIAGIVGLIGSVFAGIPAIVVIGAAMALMSLAQTIPQIFGAITTIIGSFFSNIWLSVTTEAMFWMTVIRLKVTEMWTGVTGALGQFFSSTVATAQASLMMAVQWVIAKVTGFVQGIQTAIGNLFNSIGSKIQEALSNIKIPSIADMGNAAGGAAVGAANAAGGMLSGAASKVMGGAATGYLPSGGLGGLLGAAIKESRAMPSGSSLMMANSSEAILNRGQQGAMAGAMGGRGGGTFAPNISIQASAGMDVAALADEVMRRIGSAYQTYESGFLT